MDRIYQRGFRVEEAQVLKGRRWARLSDHVPVLADLVLDRSGCAEARGL
jgi:endonuclease/exonuclease/phosphatase family metal-dependent hydrolase